MLDKTITSALLVLRKRLILTGSGSLAHVNALLAERGIDPATLPAAYRGVVQAKRGDTKRAVIAALASGPKTPADVARHMCQQAPSPTYRAASARVHQALARMAAGGLVVRSMHRWSLVNDSGAKNSLAPSTGCANQEPDPHIKAFKWREAMPQLDESTNRVLGKFRLKCLNRLAESLADP